MTLPPGCDSVFISPLPRGSELTAKTIGIVDVARLAAEDGPTPAVTMALTFSFTNSSAICVALSRSTISAGVCLGAPMPNQTLASYPARQEITHGWEAGHR